MKAHEHVSRRQFLKGVSVAAAGVFLAACRSATAVPQPTPTVKPAEATPVPEPTKAPPTPTPQPTAVPIKISMIVDPQPPELFQEYSEAATKYKEANPNITIAIEPKSMPSEQEIVPWMAAGTAPDTFRYAINQGPLYGTKGLVYDCAPIAAKMDIVDKYIEAVWKGFMWENGEVFSLPCDTNTLALWCNPVLFEQAGMKDHMPPKNWDEMIEVAKAVAKPDADPQKAVYGYTFPTTIGWSSFFFWFWLWREGGTYYDGKEFKFNSKEAAEAIKKIKYLIDEKLLPAFDDFQAPWYSGRCAMQEYGSWAIHGDIPGPWNNNEPQGKWEADYPRPEFVVAPMIQLRDDVPGYSVFAGFSHFIPKTNKYPEETAAWLWYTLSDPKYGTIQLRHGKQLLSTKVVTHEWLEHPAWAAFQKQLETTRPLLYYPEELQADSECLGPRIMKAWLGQEPIEQMLKEAYDCAMPIALEAQKSR